MKWGAKLATSVSDFIGCPFKSHRGKLKRPWMESKL